MKERLQHREAERESLPPPRGGASMSSYSELHSWSQARRPRILRRLWLTLMTSLSTESAPPTPPGVDDTPPATNDKADIPSAEDILRGKGSAADLDDSDWFIGPTGYTMHDLLGADDDFRARFREAVESASSAAEKEREHRLRVLLGDEEVDRQKQLVTRPQ